MHLTVPKDMTIEEADGVAYCVRDRIERELDGTHVAIHFCSRRGALRRLGRDAEGRGARGRASRAGRR